MIFGDKPLKGEDLPEAWAGYFENLATPQSYSAYNQYHYEYVTVQIELNSTSTIKA
jgi:hypothetical protein